MVHHQELNPTGAQETGTIGTHRAVDLGDVRGLRVSRGVRGSVVKDNPADHPMSCRTNATAWLVASSYMVRNMGS